ncbi:tetratricopeptide repeat protein [Actinoplanes octamycinicus]|uniref:tetratricopeptide repeat protein n=1 Tax=Actinoplanes octamycinicus TaxID=135948 RepID=UPI001C88DEA1|nr:tetratricopeptide repeat protein [Actinoplanes octamycinicus]
MDLEVGESDAEGDVAAAMSAMRVLALRSDSPPQVLNYIAAGGSVRKLVTIARADNVTINIPRPSTSRNLPAGNPNFTGRRAELAALVPVLDPADGDRRAQRAVLLRDGPGVGKTTLALQLAHLVSASYPRHHLFLRLTDAAHRPLPISVALESLLVAMGVDRREIPSDLGERQAFYQSELADSLLVLDDAVDEPQTRPLLPERAGCGVIITSRRQLTGLTMAFTYDVERLPDDEALALLARLIGQSRVENDPQAARMIVSSCGNLPLAIWIAGATLNATSRLRAPLARFAQQLADERHRLNLLRAGDQAVRASFDLSYRQLSAEAARMFRWLSLLQASEIGVPMLAVLVDRPEAEVEMIRDELADAHVIELAGEFADRIKMHDLLRLFAGELFAETETENDRNAALDRVYRWMQRLVDDQTAALAPGADPQVSSSDRSARRHAALQWLDLERRNIMALLRQAAAEGRLPSVISLAAALTRYFEIGSHWSDWVESAEAALSAARSIHDERAEAECLASLGRVHRLRRQPDQAIENFDRAIRLFGALGMSQDQASAAGNRGIAYREQHRFAEAAASFEKALALYRQVDDRRGAAETLNNMGYAYRYQRRTDEAIRCHDQAIPVFREIGDIEGLGWAYSNLIAVYRFQRRFDEAFRSFESAMDAFTEIHQRHGQAWAHNHIGAVHRERGDLRQARDSHQRAERVFQEITDAYGEGWAATYLALVEHDANNLDLAKAHAERGLDIFAGMPDTYGQAWTRLYLSDICLDLDDHAQAIDHASQALELFDSIRNTPGRARSQYQLGMIFARQGDQRAAEQLTAAMATAEHGADGYTAALAKLAVTDADALTELTTLASAFATMSAPAAEALAALKIARAEQSRGDRDAAERWRMRARELVPALVPRRAGHITQLLEGI